MTCFCIDLGGSFIKFGFVDESGAVSGKGEIPTPQDSFEEMVRAVSALILARQGSFDRVAFSSLGHPEPDTGIVRGFSSLPYVRDRNFKKAFLDTAGVSIEIENDANCAALAESWKGAGCGRKSIAAIILGTSIGGGIVENGQLHKGLRIGACETAGMLTGFDPVTGRYLSLQNTTAMSSLTADIAAALGRTPSEIDGRWVFDQADAGDPLCRARVEEYLRGLAFVLHNIIYFYDPEVVALGGGISRRPGLLPRVQSIMDEIDRQIGMDSVSHLVTLCRFHNDANLIGAARHAALFTRKETI